MSEEQATYTVDEIIEDEEIIVDQLEDWKVDKYIEEVKENNTLIEKYKQIKQKREQDLEIQLKIKTEPLLKRNQYLLTTLGEYAKTRKDDLKSTQTQYKLPLLSGDITIKKPAKKLNKPKKANEEKLIELYPEFVETKEVKQFKWGEAKKLFVIQGDRVFDKETGEDVTDVVEITETPEEVIIK